MNIVNSFLRRCATSGRLTPALFAVAVTTFAVQVTAEPLPEGEAVPKTQDGSKKGSEAQPAARVPAGWKCRSKTINYKTVYQARPQCDQGWAVAPSTRC